MPRGPRNQIALRRRGNYGAYAAALARGVRTAYQNRAIIKDTVDTVKRKAKSLWRPKKKAATGSSRGPSNDAIGGGNDWTVSKRTVGYKKRNTITRLSKMMEVGMLKTVYRYQGLTNFDTNLGFFNLANVQFTGGDVQIPIHIYDLTSIPNTSTPGVCYAYSWANTTAAADLIRYNINGQTPSGTLQAGWNTENGKDTGFRDSRVMRHDWSDIRINFYGPRKRTTRYEVLFVRVRDEFANPLVASVSNASLKELFAYLERPCVYSNLQTYQTNVAKKIKIVKKYTYWVSAGQTTDVDSSVGKIKEARIFMRHDRVYNLDWRHEGAGTSTLSHVQADGANYVQDETHHDYPWHGSRLMMIIRAFAPERAFPAGAFTPDANRDPTYDILIRNAVSTPY